MSGFELVGNNHDGANFQAQAVLAMVRYLCGDGVEESWNGALSRYMYQPRVVRFDNCREQGYTIFARNPKDEQINITFYEHRNSDEIFVQVNYKKTFNAPLLSDIFEENSSKWDSAFSANYGEITKVADFIVGALRDHYKSENTA